METGPRGPAFPAETGGGSVATVFTGGVSLYEGFRGGVRGKLHDDTMPFCF